MSGIKGKSGIYIRTEEHKRKISLGNKGKVRTPEMREKYRLSKLGEKNPAYDKKHSQELKKKRSIALKKIHQEKDFGFPKGHIPWVKGKTFPPEQHYNWQGGKSFEPYGLEFNKELKEQIRKRDNYICQECNYLEKQLGYKLPIHHIDYDKNNNNPDNLIALCRSCNAKANFKREDWTNYFQNKMVIQKLK